MSESTDSHEDLSEELQVPGMADEAFSVIWHLVKKLGGKVTITQRELVDQPADSLLCIWPSVNGGDMVIAAKEEGAREAAAAAAVEADRNEAVEGAPGE